MSCARAFGRCAAVILLALLALAPLSADRAGAQVAETPAVVRWKAINERIRVAIEAGQRDKLIELEKASLRAAEQAFGPDARETRRNARYLADLYYERSRYAEAVALYERSLKGMRDDEFLIIFSAETLNSVNNLAVSYNRLGRPAAAEPLFERAIRISTRVMGSGNPDTLGIMRSRVLNLLSDPSLAPKALDTARELADSIRARRSWSNLPGLVPSQSTRQLGNHSVELFRKQGVANLRAARERGNDLDAFTLLADAGWMRAERGTEDRAAPTSEAFVALQDVNVGSAAKAVERMAVRLAAERKAPGLGEAVRQLQSLDDRAIAIADETEMLRFEGGEGAFRRDQDLYREDYRNKQTSAAIEARLRAGYPDYFTFASKGTVDLASAQALLGPDEAILLTMPTRFGTHVVAISRTDARWHRSSWNQDRIAAAVKRLLWDVGATVGVDPATAARWQAEAGWGYTYDRKTAFALYGELVAPVRAVLANKRRVFIVSGGVLTSLPFGILVTDPPKGSDGDPDALRATGWFADAHALLGIPSVQALQFLRQAPAEQGGAAAGSFAGYGDPTLAGEARKRGGRSRMAVAARAMFRADLSRSGGAIADVKELKSLARLPGTATELENMRVALDAPVASVHLQDQATEAVIRAADLSHVRILALATHGVIAGELTGASEPGLVFTPPAVASDADDGFLTASEVSAMKLDADWVILSACNTAAGDGSEGAPGLSGLARAFFYAGARNLLVSHWPVRDDVASRLTVDAIKRQQADPSLGRAEALQQAMRAIRDDATHDSENDSWAHPNAWAPFSLIGAN